MAAIKKSSQSRGTGTAVNSAVLWVRWLIGFGLATTFSMIYFIAPFYMITATLALAFGYPSRYVAWLYASPILVSAVLPPTPMPFVLKLLRPMLDYFEYEEIHEYSPINTRKECLENGKNYLLLCQPHGALSFVGIASAVNATPEFRGT